MDVRIIAGSGNRPLAQAVAECLGTALLHTDVTTFPDGEQHVQLLESVRGADVFLLQPTSPPVDSNLIQLLLFADAACRAGAERITAVIPYFGYARQDRRAHGREALAARLAADLIAAAGVDRITAVDVHGHSIEGLFSVPLDHVSAVPLLVREVQRLALAADGVVVAPDLGAVKIAERFAAELDLPVAVVRKWRVSGAEVAVSGVAGDVSGRVPIIVDDMISTGGTIKAAAEAVMRAGARGGVIVAATHGLFVGDAPAVLRADRLERVIVTDSVPRPPDAGLPVQVVSIAPLLADAMGKLHRRESLSGLISYG